VNEKIGKTLTKKLKDGDVLAIIPPVGGGWASSPRIKFLLPSGNTSIPDVKWNS
jgi:hypothetical protein